MTIPDGFEPVRGYRAWYLENGYLKPTASDHIWQPGTNEAVCYADRDNFNRSVWKNVDGELKVVELTTHGLIPEPSCHCGFWMLKTPQGLIDRILEPKADDTWPYRIFFTVGREQREFVIGQVHGWGRVLPGENGWRTEFAQVEALITCDRNEKVVTDERLEKVAALYDVPIMREDAFDGPPPPTAKEKLEAKREREQAWVTLDMSNVKWASASGGGGGR